MTDLMFFSRLGMDSEQVKRPFVQKLRLALSNISFTCYRQS